MAILIFGFKYRHKPEVDLILNASLWLLRILIFEDVNELRLRLFLETSPSSVNICAYILCILRYDEQHRIHSWNA